MVPELTELTESLPRVNSVNCGTNLSSYRTPHLDDGEETT